MRVAAEDVKVTTSIRGKAVAIATDAGAISKSVNPVSDSSLSGYDPNTNSLIPSWAINPPPMRRKATITLARLSADRMIIYENYQQRQ